MPYLNPAVEYQHTPAHISWGQLLDEKEYLFEFILFAQAPIEEITTKDRKGAYILCAVTALEKQEIEAGVVLPEQFLYIDLAYKTFSRRYRALDPNIRSKVTKDNNIRIRFIKHARSSLTIKYSEVVPCTNQQKIFAEQFYSKGGKT